MFLVFLYISLTFDFRAACYLGLCSNLVQLVYTVHVLKYKFGTKLCFLPVALMKAQEQLYEIQTEVKRKVDTEENLNLTLQ